MRSGADPPLQLRAGLEGRKGGDWWGAAIHRPPSTSPCTARRPSTVRMRGGDRLGGDVEWEERMAAVVLLNELRQ